MSNTPHDALIKAILGKPEHAATALRAILPAALCEALDWSALRTEPTEYVRVDGGTRRSDLLFSVPFRAEPLCEAPEREAPEREAAALEVPAPEALIYVLFEHQSTPDPLMALRLFVYVARIFEQRVLRAGSARVPLVVSVVLSHTERPWTGALALDELYDAPRALLDALGPLVPRLSYALEDLTAMSDAEMEARIADAVVRTTWTVLRDARSANDLMSYALRLRDLLEAVFRSDRSALQELFDYLVSVTNTDLATARRVTAILPPEAREDIVNVYDELKAEGLAEGSRRTLAKLIRLRFGALSDGARACLDAADEASLDLWTERILFAATLDELFAG